MVYGDFTLGGLIRQFGLDAPLERDLFAHVPPTPISDRLRETLAENVPLAIDIGTEKARSEFIIAPVLSEVRRQASRPLSLFSGVEFNVDVDGGLRGVCDFLLSLPLSQLSVQAPVVAIVGAKNDNIKSGIGQCYAEMIAAQVFNERRGNVIPTVYGVVTTGTNWRFLQLTGVEAVADAREYYIDRVESVVGILLVMAQPQAAGPL